MFALHLFLTLVTLLSLTNRGESGSTTFVATRYLSRGGDIKDGVLVKQLNSSYFWSPVEKTDFSIGLVIPVTQENEVLNTLQLPKGKDHFSLQV